MQVQYIQWTKNTNFLNTKRQAFIAILYRNILLNSLEFQISKYSVCNSNVLMRCCQKVEDNTKLTNFNS